jgi:DNA-3-methyladenine glycosylase
VTEGGRRADLDAGAAPAGDLDLRPLPRAFYERPTARVARDLLGKTLVRQAGDRTHPPSRPPILARIVEVEAYLGERDAASHARRGPTPRAAIMFGPAGYLYVYLVYGMHHCMNFVTEADGTAGAVLIRAAEPLSLAPAAGRAVEVGRRASSGRASSGRASPERARREMSGPGKLCDALGITLADKGLDLTAGVGLFVADPGGRAPRRVTSPRVGVDYAGEWAARKLRFYIPGNPHVSARSPRLVARP